MKRLFVIFLSLLYLVMATGFTQYTHVCKGTSLKQHSLTNTNLQSPDKPCPICVSKEKNLKGNKKGCCEHQSQIIKVDDVVKKQSGFDLSVKFWGEAIPDRMLGALFDFSLLSAERSKSTYLSASVPLRATPLYILHCSYRI